MKRILIKTGVFLTTFFRALIVLSKVMNRGNTDLTMDISEARFPVVYMVRNGERYNTLHGYANKMEDAFERGTITVLDGNRSTDIEIDDYGSDILGLSFEVRDVTGERLIESTQIDDFNTTDTGIMAEITLKDLIKEDTEYSLIFLLNTGETTLRYYTKVIWTDDYHVDDKIEFAKYISNKTFDKESASEIRKYLESNSSGDNSSFANVNIHSSFSQITWGDLAPVKLTEPVPDVTQIQESTASIALRYYVTTGQNSSATTYYVEEYYRVKYTDTRMYLLDFNRTMEQILDEDNLNMDTSSLKLGIVDPDYEIIESEDGGLVVFSNYGRLFSYSIPDNRLSVLYSCYDIDDLDVRETYEGHNIKVLSADETGNVRFIVYGYMNRGRHEGEVGIQVYFYDGALNTLEEEIYIPYEKSEEILLEEMKTLSYVSKENILYVMLGRTAYAIDISNRTYDIMMTQTVDKTLFVSNSGEMIVWQTSSEPYDCQELLLMDLESGSTIAIDSDEGDYIYPLGFMGEDVVYGVAHSSDIVRDTSGNTIFPMYEIYIRNSVGAVLKTYAPENAYVTDCEIGDKQMTIHRVTKKNDNEYSSIADDQIMSSQEAEEGKNSVVVTNEEVYKATVSIAFKSTLSKKSVQIRNPKEVLFEGGRQMEMKMVERDDPLYYVYGSDGIKGIFADPANAVIEAYDDSGVVIDDQGQYVYMKGNRPSRNQILAITARGLEENETSLSVCLETMMGLEGVVKDTRSAVSAERSPYEILKSSLTEASVLDLSGCQLDAMLYYVGLDYPVLAVLNDGEAVLVSGYNEVAVVIFNPKAGTLSKMSNSEASEWFTKNGNNFVTYIKPKED